MDFAYLKTVKRNRLHIRKLYQSEEFANSCYSLGSINLKKKKQRNEGEQFISMLTCIACEGGRFSVLEKTGTDITKIQCRSCGEIIEVVDGIYHFYKNRGRISGVDYSSPNWREFEREKESEIEREQGLSHEWLRSLPFPPQVTDTTFQYKFGALGQNFFDVINCLDLKGTENVLDMATGCGWTSREFAKRGCDVVSTDIRRIKYHGLRSAEAYFEEDGGVSFQRLRLEFGLLPFEDHAFDIVFCQNAFQYVQDLSMVVREIKRVLKPNGKLVLAWTGTHALLKKTKWGPGHYLTTYVHHMRKAGFQVRVYYPLSLYKNLYNFVSNRSSVSIVVQFARLFSHAWEISPLFKRLFLRYVSLPIGFVFGFPFNLIAAKSELQT